MKKINLGVNIKGINIIVLEPLQMSLFGLRRDKIHNAGNQCIVKKKKKKVLSFPSEILCDRATRSQVKCL